MKDTLHDAVERYEELLRSGNAPTPGEFASQYSEHADQLLRVLPTVVALAGLESENADGDQNLDGASSVTAAPGELKELGDFRLRREIGRGGMGIVYEAEQISLGRRVAVKVMPFAALLDRRQLDRFRNEARAAAMLKHPNIVNVHSVGFERGVHFYAMELVDGCSLADLIGSLSASPSPHDASQEVVRPQHQMSVDTKPVAALSTERANNRATYYRSIARLGMHAARAVHVAHEAGVVHRDIKPSNLLLDQDGNILVTDFGLARVQQDQGVTLTGDIVGTLRYMSPEQINDAKAVDHRSDIYSLGATLFELAAGRPAYSAESKPKLLQDILQGHVSRLRSLAPDVPRDLETIVVKAMSHNPDARYQNANELEDDLDRFRAGKPVLARPVGNMVTAWRWCLRNRRVAVLAGLIFALLSVLAVAGFVGQQKFAAMADTAQRSLYVADVNRVQQYLHRGETAEATAILERHNPSEGQEDLRNIEWYLLRSQCNANAPDQVLQHRVICYAADFSPDGKRLATAEWLHRGLLWDVATGETLQTLKSDTTGPTIDVRYFPDGNQVVTAGANDWGSAPVRIFDTVSQEDWGLELPVEIDSRLSPDSIDVSADGKYVASGVSSRYTKSGKRPSVIAVWEASSRELVALIDGFSIHMHDVAFSPDGTLLVAAFADGTLRFISTESWTVARTTQAHSSDAFAISFSHDGTTLASSGLKPSADGVIGEIAFWNVKEGTRRGVVHHHEKEITSLDFDPTGTLLAAGSRDHEVTIWDSDTLTCRTRFKGHAAAVEGVRFSPDGRKLCTSSADTTTKIWNVATLFTKSNHSTKYTKHAGRALWMAFADDGQAIWSIASSGGLHKWHTRTLETMCQIELSGGDGSELAVSPKGNWLGVVPSVGPKKPVAPRTLHIFDARSGEPIREIELPATFMHGVQFSPVNDNYVIVGTNDGIHSWDVESGKLVWSVGEIGYIKRLRYSPDGSRIAVALNGGRLAVLDAHTGNLLARIRSEAGWGTVCADYSPDGKVIATGGGDYKVKFWDSETLELLREIPLNNWIGTLAFSPDGTRLITGGTDNTLRLFDFESGQVLLTFPLQETWSLAAEFSPDGKKIAVSSGDVYLWSAHADYKSTVSNAVVDDTTCLDEPVGQAADDSVTSSQQREER